MTASTGPFPSAAADPTAADSTAAAPGVASSAVAGPAAADSVGARSAGSAGPGSRVPRIRERRPPLDPRLIRRVGAARRYLVLTVALGIVQALCTVATALALADAMAALIVDRIPPLDRPATLAVLVVAVLLRALAHGVQQRFAHRAATDTIAQLRADLVEHAGRLGPRWLEDRGVHLTALLGQGLENLRPYLTGYLPQLVLAATVTPLCMAVVLTQDPTSFVAALLTIPIIPIFMILIGQLTEGRSEKLLADMRRLSAQVLDLVAGLPTLSALGRERGPVARVRTLGEAHRRSTMATLKYAFLSSMVLEFMATLSVALIAVGIGLRLVDGGMALFPALAVLILAPEIYLPLRQVGVQFHASTDGVAAATAAFEVLDTPVPPDGTRQAPDPTGAVVEIDGVSVASRDGFAPAGATGALHPGRITVISGESGSGKTTLAHCLLRLAVPDAGAIRLRTADGTVDTADGTVDLADVEAATWWPFVAHLPQRPVLLPGTVRENVLRGVDESELPPGALVAAAEATGLTDVLAQLPGGWDHRIGHGGLGISLGQRQRIGLTRTLLRREPLLVLDEPTAHLDPEAETQVLDRLEALARAGRTVVLIAHRERLLERGDTVLRIHGARDTITPDRFADDRAAADRVADDNTARDTIARGGGAR